VLDKNTKVMEGNEIMISKMLIVQIKINIVGKIREMKER
jgi:hypothetical protein